MIRLLHFPSDALLLTRQGASTSEQPEEADPPHSSARDAHSNRRSGAVPSSEIRRKEKELEKPRNFDEYIHA
jgi:hypothetical protein